MFKRLLTIAVLAIAASPVSAASLTERQRNILDKYAEVLAITERCPTYKPNELLFTVAMQTFGIKNRDAPHVRDYLRKKLNTALVGIADKSEPIVCVTGRFMYGPRGAAVENAILEK